MTKEEADLMIAHQGVYEIVYQKDGEAPNLWHISMIEYAKDYDQKCILAYCQECDKDLVFNLNKIKSAIEYWTGILSRSATVPKDGLYLVARVGLGQGVDKDYILLSLRKGDYFTEHEEKWEKPLAYHYIPDYSADTDVWKGKEIVFRKWEYEEVHLPQKGIPIISYKHNDNYSPVQYHMGGLGDFMDGDSFSGYIGWSERWNGFKMLGYTIVNEYDSHACRIHIENRLKAEPDLFD